MQMLFQHSDGSREPIDQQRYVDLKLRYKDRLRTVFQEKHIHVVCLAGNERKVPDRPLRYGGGRKQLNPFEYDLRRSINQSNWRLDVQ